MAERIVSPGVFTNENDRTFLPVGIAGIGAAILGPTTKGPAMIPTEVSSYSDYEVKFGVSDAKSYVPFTLREYLQHSGTATVVRILGIGGYTHTSVAELICENQVIGVLHHTTLESGSELDATATGANSSSGLFDLDVYGVGFAATESYASMSLNYSDANYIGKVFGTNPNSSTVGVYNYTFFKNAASNLTSTSVVTVTSSILDLSTDYQRANTPWIQSQEIAGNTYPLFRFKTLSDGDNANTEIKVAVANIKYPSSVPGSIYGTFSIVIRKVTDDDRNPVVYENYNEVTLDINSPNFIGKVIGNKTPTYNSTEKRIFWDGDFANKSNYVTVEINANVLKAAYSADLVPHGFSAIQQPLTSTGGNMPTASMVTRQIYSNLYNNKIYFGFNFDFDNFDNLNYLKPLASGSTAGANVAFNLSSTAVFTDQTPSISDASGSNIEGMRFIVPFQGGFDGRDPAVPKNMGSDITGQNVMGYDCSGAYTSGSVMYTRGLELVSDQHLVDINLLITPGLSYDLHTTVIDKAIETVEGRGDAFYIFDAVKLTQTALGTAVSTVNSLDSSYAATYYPWIKVRDVDQKQSVWVPPSAMVAGAISYNDKVGYEWYAPAGLNRGILNAEDVYYQLSQPNRDTLYEGRVNPIAFFPNEGISVRGQKTLQALPSALDRVNVRRLLINLKKFIASSTKYLVFEQNTSATRARFLNIVNPYMESVQQRSGLYAFLVKMDESNNTADVIDRNEMRGEIWIQPTRTAEFIIVEMNILPTGASFGE